LKPARLDRGLAIAGLQRLWAGTRLDDLLMEMAPEQAGRGTLQWLWSACLRQHGSLRRLTELLLRKALRPEDEDLSALLHLALEELRAGQRPDFAVVNDWVGACALLHKEWARGLVNALLRRYLREREPLEEQIRDAHWNHPQWLVRRLQQVYPTQWPDILAANLREAPLWLRVNPQAITPAAYAERLAEASLPAQSHAELPEALRLDAAVPVRALPGWERGWVSIQDGAAQRAAHILAPRPDERVLDACAAPGGKTTHLLSFGVRQLTALDRSQARLERLRRELQRLQLPLPSLHVADAADVDAWWDGMVFDAILLDAPCTASGVIRRHPDILLRRREDDVERVRHEQRRLLAALWRVLKPGGRLLYCTCSVLPEENGEQIASFLEEHDDARALPHPQCGQRLPGEEGMDGFFYALLGKIPMAVPVSRETDGAHCRAAAQDRV
jgi:16S rRNA (cytosine967-C5)-methyltransferase